MWALWSGGFVRLYVIAMFFKAYDKKANKTPKLKPGDRLNMHSPFY